MENRSQIVKEFFELIIYLNRANPKSNSKTELVFDIKTNTYNSKILEFGCYLRGIESPQFLVLSKKHLNKRWISSGYTRFINIEDYCRDQLNIYGTETNKTILMSKIITKLRSFGVFQK